MGLFLYEFHQDNVVLKHNKKWQKTK